MHLPAEVAGSASYWYRWTRENEKKLGLQPVVTAPYSFYFRLSGSGGEIVDIWQQDGIWQGCFTKWVKEVTVVKDTTIIYQFVGALYLKKYQLDLTQAAAAARLIKDSGILQLQSDEKINGWVQGLDGYEVLVQYSAGTNYYFKSYWTPNFQHDLPEAFLIESFSNKLDKIINAQLVRKAFLVDIPFPCFSTNNSGSTCLIVTTDKYQQYERELVRYKRQIRRKK